MRCGDLAGWVRQDHTIIVLKCQDTECADCLAMSSFEEKKRKRGIF